MKDSRKSSPLAGIWFALTMLVMAFGFYKAMTAPREATMGNLYRVIFYHVPHAILSFVFPYINCIASLLYLAWKEKAPERALKADAMAVASASVTVLYASIGLATGMLWGRAAWGIWWAWDARLTTYLLLWLLYVSYMLLRSFASGGQTSMVASVLGLFAAIDIPICYMSIHWWRTQHPAPIFFGDQDSGMDKSMLPAFFWNVAVWAMWGAFLLSWRYALERRRQAQELREIEAMLHAEPVLEA